MDFADKMAEEREKEEALHKNEKQKDIEKQKINE